MPCSNDDFWDLVDQLPEVTPVEGSTYTALKVRGKGFGYHWPATATAGLKQERQEQIALVSERPDVFETQFVAGQFGWVVVRLERIEPGRARRAGLRGLAAHRSGAGGDGVREPSAVADRGETGGLT